MKAFFKNIFISVFFAFLITSLSAQDSLRWQLTDDNGIEWQVEANDSHMDHIEMSGFFMSSIVHYGYHNEADRATVKILSGANGLLTKGEAIRENYHPLTGEGLNAHNFSWSAAHIIMLLLDEE